MVNMTEILLKIDGISAGYGNATVLRDVSIDIRKGDVIGIIGPNGHGKTTLLNTISGFVRPKYGAIIYFGRVINLLRPEQIVKRGIIQIPQGDLVFPDMTIEENLYVGSYLEDSPARRNASLEDVFQIFPKLQQRRDQVASTLSGGERRMLAIGRGLMSPSEILMVDEPSLGLAPIVIDQVYAVLDELKKQGRTIILVEENPGRVEDFADQVVLLDNGSIVWSGSAGELKESDNILETYLGG